MMLKFPRRWPFVALILGTGYACSGNPEVVIKPTDVGSGGSSASGGTGGVGGALGGRAGSSTGGTISTTGGSAGKSGNTGGKSGNTGGTGGTSSGGTAGGEETGGFGGFPDIDFDYDAGVVGQGGACERAGGKGTLVKRPMDIIVTIDNSLSMEGEILAVQQRINDDFARIIDLSEIDYRVIMVSRYGNVFDENYDSGQASDSAYSVCIDGPLSSLDCPGSQTATTPLVAHNPPRFYHHSTDIGSNNLWCRLLGSYDVTDPFPADPRSTGDQNGTPWVPVAPNGWGAYLRPEAFKVFVAITDDSPSGTGGGGCSNLRGSGLNGTSNQAGANAFDTVLRTLAPTQFGPVDGERNYRWYSIIGMAGDGTTDPPPLQPDDPTVPTQCCTYDPTNDTAGSQNCIGNTAPPSNGAGNGVGYQYLSILTGGLRYPSCYNDNFDGIFNAIAQGVIEGSRTSCEYDVPVPTNGIVDFDQTIVSYLPAGNAAAAIELTRVASDVDCGSAPAYYFNQDFTKIFLCPNTCVTVQADDMAEVSIDFGCLGS
jgi:hypothetical protein